MKSFRISNKFKNQKLSEKWVELIKIRNICNISIEEKRAAKEIGSSLEANLKIQINNKLKNLTENTDFLNLYLKLKLITKTILILVHLLVEQKGRSVLFAGKLKN